MDDSNGELECLKIDRQRREQIARNEGAGGASIDYGGNGSGNGTVDRRFTRLIDWAWLAIGGAFVAGVYWVASSISNLNVTIGAAMVRIEYQDKRQDLSQAEITQLQKEVAELQGKVFRGVNGYGETDHGNK